MEYAMRTVSDWTNPIAGFVNLSRDPSLTNLVKVSSFPVGYWAAGQVIGGTAAEGFGMGSHYSMITSGTRVLPYTAALVGGYALGAAVGTAILTPFGKGNEAITFYSSLYNVVSGIRDIPEHAVQVGNYYLVNIAGKLV